MLLFGALPSPPFELLDAPPTPAAIEISRERAAAARFVLDLVAADGRPRQVMMGGPEPGGALCPLT